MFRAAVSFNQPIGSWNTTNVTNMERVFDGASVFNQALSNWNTSQVTTMLAMFQNAYAFNQNLNHFNTANVKDMNSMFWSATKFNQDLSSWNIGNVTTLRNLLENTSFSIENYEKLLNNWSQQNVKPNVPFGAQGLNYCNAKSARDILTNSPNNWIITDAGKNCPPENLILSQTEIYENTTEVGTISSTDESTTVIYTLVSGEGSEDNPKFALHTTNGLLVFLEAPDFENPTDLGNIAGNNTYSIRIRATDATGLYTEKIFIITVLDADDVPPIITITAPTKKAKGPITDTTFTVSDRFSIKSVEIDTSSVAAADNIICQPAPGSTTHSTNFPFINDSPSPTNHLTLNCTIRVTTSGKLVLKATDNLDYSSTTTEEGYAIDTMGPTFTVANIDIGPSGLHNPIVSFEAYDPVGVEKYEISFIQNNNGPGIDTINTIITVPYSSGIKTYVANLDPDENSHVIEIKAFDSIGNTTSRRISFPPIVTINAPTIISNQTINDTTVTITSPVEGHQIGNIIISGSASTGVTLGTCTDKNGNTTAPYNTTVNCQILGIKETGMVAVEAKDITSGFVGSNLQKYFHDTTAPYIIITAPTKIKIIILLTSPLLSPMILIFIPIVYLSTILAQLVLTT